jgi:hypothetical protein
LVDPGKQAAGARGGSVIDRLPQFLDYSLGDGIGVFYKVQLKKVLAESDSFRRLRNAQIFFFHLLDKL